MVDQKYELRVRLLNGHEFSMELRSSPHSRDVLDHVDEIVAKVGATETYPDGSWTRYPPSQIESVTYQPKRTVEGRGKSRSVGL